MTQAYDTFTLKKEVDGRWLAIIEGIPGMMAYGVTSDEAIENVTRICKAAFPPPPPKAN